MQKGIIFMFTLLVLVATNCSHETEEESAIHIKDEQSSTENTSSLLEAPPSSTTFTYQNHQFEMVYYYQPYLDFIEKTEEEPDDPDALYLQLIINPLTDGDGEWLAREWGFSRPTRLPLLKKHLTSLIDHHHLIDQEIVKALKKSAEMLEPGVDKTIYVLPANPDNARGMKRVKGVSGVTWGPDFTTIQIAPSIYEENILKFTLAHEYHHSVLFEHQAPETDDTLLEAVLLEGKADFFAQQVYPEVTSPWSNFTSKENEKEAWTFLAANKNTTDPTIINDFFNGNSSKQLPEWATYKMGNAIMEDFVRENPNLSIAAWTNLSAEEMLEKSNNVEKHKISILFHAV